MNQVLIIDGDIPIFRAAATAEITLEADGVIYRAAQRAVQEQILEESIAKIQEETGIDEVVMALSSSEGNFRKELYDDYKGNRKGKSKPVGYYKLLEYVEDTFDTLEFPKLEGDDLLGILGSHGTYKGKEVVILSWDKDLATIPGKYIDGDTMELKEQSQYEADRFFMYQAITGDTTDNFKGCKGIGGVRAERLLQKIEDANPEAELLELRTLWWNAILEAYLKAGQTREDAILNARMARILTNKNWDAENQEVVLWTPESFLSEI